MKKKRAASRSHSERPAQRPVQVCIVSSEFIGPVPNGGIGTALTSLAYALAEAGQQVTLLYTRGQSCPKGSVEEWTRHFKKAGITFVPLPAPFEYMQEFSNHLRVPYSVYAWLKTRSFDVIQFPEWGGLGYYCLLARREGLAFKHTTMLVGTHGSLMWTKEGNQQPLSGPAELEMDFIERQSVALADVLISPSQYLVDWMRSQNWKLPADTQVRQYVRPRAAADPAPRAAASRASVRELVFFGRLEDRKGVRVFCDALDRLAQQQPGLPIQRITFLGRAATVENEDGSAYVTRRAQAWPWPCALLSSLDQPQALEYLRGAGRMAWMPSLVDNLPNTVLECLYAGIPFAAAHTGGIPEMIASEDREAVCFAPHAGALAERIAACVLQGAPLARPAVDAEENRAWWVAWHAAQRAHTYTLPAPVPEFPKVSLCITHYNRPALLRQALESAGAQDYPNYEVVLVDDGSSLPAAIAALDALEPEFARKGWKIVRQENRYLGAARNTAVRHATGEYVLFMDDDDYARKDEISVFVRAAQNTRADILTCADLIFFGDERPNPAKTKGLLWAPLGALPAVGALRNVYGPANAFFRRDVFERIGGFTEDYGVGYEDWEFFSRACLLELRLEVVPEPLFWYRVKSDSMLRTGNSAQNNRRVLRPYRQLLSPVGADMASLVQAMNAENSQIRRGLLEIKELMQFEGLLLAGRELLQAGVYERAEFLLKSALLVADAVKNDVARKKVLEALAELDARRGASSAVAKPAPRDVPPAETFDLLVASGDIETALKTHRARLNPELVTYIRARAVAVASQGQRELAGALGDLAGIVENMVN